MLLCKLPVCNSKVARLNPRRIQPSRDFSLNQPPPFLKRSRAIVNAPGGGSV